MGDDHNNKAYCINCDRDVEYRVEVTTQVFKSEKAQGMHFVYNEFAARCPICGEEIYVPWINDRNVAYRNNLVSDYISRRRAVTG